MWCGVECLCDAVPGTVQVVFEALPESSVHWQKTFHFSRKTVSYGYMRALWSQSHRHGATAGLGLRNELP